MASSHIKYTPRPDATPETELDALAAMYAFVLECQAKKEAADATGDRNEVKEVTDIDPKHRLPQ